MSNPVVKDGLYRGTIAYDEPLRTHGLPWSKVLGGRPGKRNDPEYNRLRHLSYREKNRERCREYMREYKRKWRKTHKEYYNDARRDYMREYMRKWRAKKRAEASAS